MSSHSPPADWTPCIGCGLCCDGTLFSLIEIAPDEEQRLEDLGIPVSNLDGTRRSPMPCRFSCEGRCTIYADRYRSCRRFRCKLLREYEAGALTRDQAEGKVRTALELCAEAASSDPAAARLADRIRIREETPDPITTNRVLFLKMAALDYFLDLHFRTKGAQVVRED